MNDAENIFLLGGQRYSGARQRLAHERVATSGLPRASWGPQGSPGSCGEPRGSPQLPGEPWGPQEALGSPEVATRSCANLWRAPEYLWPPSRKIFSASFKGYRTCRRPQGGRGVIFKNWPQDLFWDPGVVKIGFLAKRYSDFTYFHNFSTDF